MLHEQWDLPYLREKKTPRRSWYDDNDDDGDGDDDNVNHDNDNHDDDDDNNNDNIDKQFWFKTFNKKS